MTIWFRAGPFSLSSRGRVGVRAGPVGVYGGGRRRRRSSRGSGGVVAVIVVAAILIALAVEYWYVTLGIVALLAVCLYLGARVKRHAEAHGGSETRASDVPIVNENRTFCIYEEARRGAMSEARAAQDDEDRLVPTVLATNLYQAQLEQVSAILDRAKQLSNLDPRRDVAVEFLNGWIDQAGTRFGEWSEEQRRLVAAFGDERAQKIVDEKATPRLQTIVDRARDELREQVEAKDSSPTPTHAAPTTTGTKTCPDCAEEVKIAARKSRYCGYRFDAEIETKPASDKGASRDRSPERRA